MSNYCSTSSPTPYRLGDLGKAAIQNARAGLPVVQLKQCGKQPVNRGWQRQASKDTEKITRWWTINPRCNIGIVLPPGVIVIDLDPRNADEPTDRNTTRLDALMSRLQQLTGELPATRTTRTGSGGKHLFFTVAPAIGGLIGAHCGIAGVDILGFNALVVAPGSIHPKTGAVYELENDLPIAALPDQAAQALINASTNTAPKANASARAGIPAAHARDRHVERTTASAPAPQRSAHNRLIAYATTAAAKTSEGNRNKALYSTALFGVRIDAPAAAFDEIIDKWVELGLSRAECVDTVNSARKSARCVGGDQS